MSDVPLPLSDAVRRPDAPNHMMVLRPVTRRIVVRKGTTILADTEEAIRLMEIGKSLYDPVIYMPQEAVSVPMVRLEKSSHCPLKGDATYFALSDDSPAIAWSYEEPFDFSSAIKGLIAFYADHVTIEEHGVG